MLRKEELMLRIAKAKQRCSQEAPSEDTGRLSIEIKDLKARLGEIRNERESVASTVESLNSQIQALRASRSSVGLQMTEKKGIQNILLAINGLQLADVAEDQCEFVYDTYSKVHLDSAAEFTSLHPDIDWAAVVRDAVDSSSLSTRQYAVAVMKTNAAIKALLEDIKRVKRMTFVDLSHSGGIQVRIEFFSRKRGLRFYLNFLLETIDSYRRMHREPAYDWSTEVVYGSIDNDRLGECLDSASISSEMPFLSIFNHVDGLLATL
ncbi:hypothetical protein LPJ56_002352 [Coemansia sp. RSA 2599]|nr:hypothetical protein LPJ56_002352 [Coemansia sp. RSA 2599]